MFFERVRSAQGLPMRFDTFERGKCIFRTEARRHLFDKMPRPMPVQPSRTHLLYFENEKRIAFIIQPSALPSRQLRHYSRHNPFAGINLQFRLVTR